MRIGLLAIGGWLVAAALTVGASWSAISVVRDSVVPQSLVDNSLPAPAETGPVPTTSRPSPTATVPATKSLAGQGGSVTARCVNGKPSLVRVVPRQGYNGTPDDSQAEVKFTSPTHQTEIKISCAGGTVGLTKEEKAVSAGGGGNDNGGGRGRGRGRSGGGGGNDG